MYFHQEEKAVERGPGSRYDPERQKVDDDNHRNHNDDNDTGD